jgi:hypothetical protein
MQLVMEDGIIGLWLLWLQGIIKTVPKKLELVLLLLLLVLLLLRLIEFLLVNV